MMSPLTDLNGTVKLTRSWTPTSWALQRSAAWKGGGCWSTRRPSQQLQALPDAIEIFALKHLHLKITFSHTSWVTQSQTVAQFQGSSLQMGRIASCKQLGSLSASERWLSLSEFWHLYSGEYMQFVLHLVCMLISCKLTNLSLLGKIHHSEYLYSVYLKETEKGL